MQAIRQAKVECPRCHKIISVKPGHPDVECNCHLYCQHGTKPSDCDLLKVQARSRIGIRVNADLDDVAVIEAGVVHPPWDALGGVTTHFFGKSGGYCGNAQRFNNISIPSGVTINKAYILFTCDYSQAGGTAYTTIDGETADNAATFGNIADYNARGRTTASVSWVIGAGTPWVKNVIYSSPDISAIIQEIVDRAGWTTGNSLVVFTEDTGGTSTAYRRAETHDGNPDIAPQLHIEWTPVGVKSTTPTQLGWGFGLHTGDSDEGDDVLHRTYYCNTHSVYSSKVPMLVEVDWRGFAGKRAPSRLRMSHGKY